MSQNDEENKQSFETAKNFCLNSLFSDVYFVTKDDELIPGHKVILAASCDYFKDLLLKPENEIRIHFDFATTVAFTTVLQYLYTGVVTIDGLTDEDIIEIYNLCKIMRLKSMSETVRQYLFKIEMKLRNVGKLFDVALKHNLFALKHKCLVFVDNNAQVIIHNKELFTSFSLNLVKEIVERDFFVVKEIEIFKALLNWKTRNQNTDVTKIMKRLRLNLVESDEFDKFIRSTNLITEGEFVVAQQSKTFPHRSIPEISEEFAWTSNEFQMSDSYGFIRVIKQIAYGIKFATAVVLIGILFSLLLDPKMFERNQEQRKTFDTSKFRTILQDINNNGAGTVNPSTGIFLLSNLTYNMTDYHLIKLEELGAFSTVMKFVEKQLHEKNSEGLVKAFDVLNDLLVSSVTITKSAKNGLIVHFLNCYSQFKTDTDLIFKSSIAIFNSLFPTEEYSQILPLLTVCRNLMKSEIHGIDISYNAVGIVSRIILKGQMFWISHLTSIDKQTILNDLRNEISKWTLGVKRRSITVSFGVALHALEKGMEWPEAQYFFAWNIANRIRENQSKYCPLFIKENGLQILREVLNRKELDERLATLCSLIVDEVEKWIKINV